jgi:NitT/TauT family transport system substrate-binding protein
MKKALCVLAVITVFSTLLWAGGKKDAAPAAAQPAAQQSGPVLSGKKVIVADANSTHHLNLYVAYEKGLFAKRGLEVEIRQTSSGVAAVVGGEADIVFNCPTGVITPICQGTEHHDNQSGEDTLYVGFGGAGQRALQDPRRP